MFIQTEATPNPATLKFIPGRAVLDSGTMEFTDRDSATRSPLAERLFAVPGVTGVFYGSDFVTVTKDDSDTWEISGTWITADFDDGGATGVVRLLVQVGSTDYCVNEAQSGMHYDWSDFATECWGTTGNALAATAKIKQIPELREKRAKLINIIDEYAEILPKEEHVQHEAFMEIIDGYRKDTKIIIQKAEYVKIKEDEKAPKQENFIRHRYKFKLLGTIPDFIEFVNMIENHTRFLKVDAINVKPLGAMEETGEALDDKADDAELAAASEPVKEIELVVSTYTYSRGHDKK